MAPILLKKREDNHAQPTDASSSKTSKPTTTTSTATIVTRVSVASREKKERDNNANVKTTEEPTKRATSSSSTSSSSSSRLSSRATVATGSKSKEPEKPEATEPASRKTVKTPPTTGGSHKASAAPPVAVAEKPTAKAPAQGLPSQTLHKHKQAPVWATGKKKHKTSFGAAYDSGSIPCRINHGSIRNAVQWTKEPDTLDFSPLLVTCVDGFQETEHPFVFLARTMFRELMKVDDAREKTLTILPQVIPPLRMALMSSDDDVFLMALEATRILSDVVEDEMNTYLPKLTQQIHRKLLTKQLRSPVEDTLATLERNGGKEALAIIRNKIPTYVSLH